jgi:hypothetical protein
VSDGKGLGQPACQEGGRSVKERKNSNTDMMYICVSMCVMLSCCVIVPDHVGGRPRNINAWFLYTHMVYL